MKTLSFYALGEEMTTIVRNFIQEGEYYKAYSILKDGGMPDKLIKEFFYYKVHFKGDTRTEEGLTIHTNETELENINNFYYFGVFMALKTDLKDDFEEYGTNRTMLNLKYHCRNKKLLNFQTLLNVIPFDELINMFANYILEEEYHLYTDTTVIEKIHNDASDTRRCLDGAILPDGSYVACGYQGHYDLYHILYSLNLSNSSQWMDDTKTIHVSSGQMSGPLAFTLKDRLDGDAKITDAQLQTLYNMRNLISGTYGERNTVMNLLIDYNSSSVNKGGKYNNLMFLKRYYPEIKLPTISLNKLDTKFCIRTSPKLSLPGLLTSIFEPNENSIKEIEETWKKYKDLRGIVGNEHYENKLNYFYQEYLEGSNGVCHFHSSENVFNYSLSSNRGDVVNGVSNDNKLPSYLIDELHTIANKLSIDLSSKIQLEFVIHENNLYIVQLRTLKTKESKTFGELDEYFVSGKTFTSGFVDKLTKDDILIVDEDCDSEMLIGKKALIVRNKVEFSHILALSNALNIPSMYNTKKFNLNKNKTYTLNTNYKVGYLLVE